MIKDNFKSLSAQFLEFFEYPDHNDKENFFNVRLIVICATFGINLLALALPLVILQVYDRIIPNQAYETFTLLISGLVVAITLDAILKIAKNNLSAWIASKFEHRMGKEIISRYLNMDLEDYEKEPPGKQMDILLSIERIKDFISTHSLGMLIDLPFSMLFFFLIWYIAGPVFIIPLASALIYILISAKFGMRLHKALENKQFSDDQRYSFTLNILRGIHTIKSFSIENLIARKYEKLQEKGSQVTNQMSFAHANLSDLGIFFSNFTLISVVILGGFLVLNQSLTIGGLAACTLLAGRSLQPIQRLVGLWSQFQRIKIAKERLSQMQSVGQTLLEIEAKEESNKNVKGSLQIKNLSFKAPSHNDFLFKNLNLIVNAKEFVAIDAHGGEGKTALLSIVSGIVKPSDGTILIDGERNINQLHNSELRKLIGYIPKNAIIFQGSILENLTVFQIDELYDEAMEVVKLIGLDKICSQLPDGFNTNMTSIDSDNSITAGIKQLITIARGFILDPKIILFDESNANLDSHKNSYILKLLKAYKGKKTIICISQDPSYLGLADKVYTLNKGCIEEKSDLHYEPISNVGSSYSKVTI